MDLFENSDELFDFISSSFPYTTKINKRELLIKFDGEANSYDIKVDWKDESCEIYIKNYGTSPKNEKCAFRLYEYLLKANSSMSFIYFSLLEDNRPELKSRLSFDGLNSELVRKVFEYIVVYADMHYFNVLNLANNEMAEIIVDEELD